MVFVLVQNERNARKAQGGSSGWRRAQAPRARTDLNSIVSLLRMSCSLFDGIGLSPPFDAAMTRSK
jgi:hypothetical protein